MLSASTYLTQGHIGAAAGHVRMAMERTGFEDIFVTKSGEGFRARGIRGRSPAAMLAAYFPLGDMGFFSRSAVDVSCMRSLTEGDERLRVTVRVRSIREFDDHEEVDWVSRGPGELLGDLFQSRRVLRALMESMTRPTNLAPVNFEATLRANATPEERRTRFQERYQHGKRKRKIRLWIVGVLIVAAVGVQLWLNGRA